MEERQQWGLAAALPRLWRRLCAGLIFCRDTQPSNRPADQQRKPSNSSVQPRPKTWHLRGSEMGEGGNYPNQPFYDEFEMETATVTYRRFEWEIWQRPIFPVSASKELSHYLPLLDAAADAGAKLVAGFPQREAARRIVQEADPLAEEVTQTG